MKRPKSVKKDSKSNRAMGKLTKRDKIACTCTLPNGIGMNQVKLVKNHNLGNDMIFKSPLILPIQIEHIG